MNDCEDCDYPICIRDDCPIWQDIKDSREVDEYQDEKE